MKDNNQTLLNEEIESVIGDLDNLAPECEDYSKIVDNLSKLYKLRIEETKNDAELEEKIQARLQEVDRIERELALKKKELELKEQQIDNEVLFHEQDEQFKKDQIRNQKIDRWINVGVQVGITVLGLLAYDCWYHKGLEFEKTGTVTSGMTRNVIARMLPNKK